MDLAGSGESDHVHIVDAEGEIIGNESRPSTCLKTGTGSTAVKLRRDFRSQCQLAALLAWLRPAIWSPSLRQARDFGEPKAGSTFGRPVWRLRLQGRSI